jgi:hypothetical protein
MINRLYGSSEQEIIWGSLKVLSGMALATMPLS